MHGANSPSPSPTCPRHVDDGIVVPVPFCYILRCADGAYYVGSTEDVDARLTRHQEGHASVFTAARRPVVLAYQEACASMTAARARERQLKGWTRTKKEALISGELARLKSRRLATPTVSAASAITRPEE